jgi:hypothetical protein
MSHYKIKLEDKAAFLNRLEKQGIGVDSYQVKDNKLEGYFEIDIQNPEADTIVKALLKQSPKIDKIKEYLIRIIREELKRK